MLDPKTCYQRVRLDPQSMRVFRLTYNDKLHTMEIGDHYMGKLYPKSHPLVYDQNYIDL